MRSDSQLVIDWTGSLAARAPELRARLGLLAEEWVLARECGLSEDSSYVTDFELEQGGVRAAYTGAVVLQIALLSADLDGRNQG